MSESNDLTEGSPIDPGSQAWLDSVVEDVIDFDVPIIDTHHHLWSSGGTFAYGLSDLEADLGRGHNIVDSVFVECRASYDDQAPLQLAPVGETEFVVGEATRSSRRLMSGIVAHADLTGLANLDEVLDTHFAAADGRLRGIRHSGPHARHPEVLMIPGSATAGLYADEQFRAGVERLGERGLSYDTWHYHYQNQDFAELACAVPGTAMVLDHFGTPLGVGPYETQREAIYEQWRLGFGWNTAARPPASEEFVRAQRRYYLHTIESFGPERCMFESNCPVDRLSLSCLVLWNGFKKMVADFSPAERDALFRGTATRICRLDS